MEAFGDRGADSAAGKPDVGISREGGSSLGARLIALGSPARPPRKVHLSSAFVLLPDLWVPGQGHLMDLDLQVTNLENVTLMATNNHLHSLPRPC